MKQENRETGTIYIDLTNVTGLGAGVGLIDCITEDFNESSSNGLDDVLFPFGSMSESTLYSTPLQASDEEDLNNAVPLNMDQIVLSSNGANIHSQDLQEAVPMSSTVVRFVFLSFFFVSSFHERRSCHSL